jgi:hypothetical protein
VLTEDEQFISMPSSQKEKQDTVRIADAKKRQTLVSFGGANRMIVSGRYAYSHQGKQLKVIDRFQLIALQGEIDALKAANAKRAKEKKAAAEDEERVAVLEKEIKTANEAIAAREAAKAGCERWSVEHPLPIGFMLAGETLFTGGDGRVTAVNANTGETTWHASVEGKAYGLVAANGQLFVSTDRGFIYCFRAS